MSKIKICGLRRPEDIEYVNRYKPDYAGFILVPGRWRSIEDDVAVCLKNMLLKDITPVGVFFDEKNETIASKVDKIKYPVIQLHGHETESDISWIKSRLDVQIIKAISVKSKSDIIAWKDSDADFLLLDNGNGGTGDTFDWNEFIATNHRIFIAGGINADNIDAALKLGAYGIDVSGGVETDKLKDENKIKTIIDKVRRTECQ